MSEPKNTAQVDVQRETSRLAYRITERGELPSAEELRAWAQQYMSAYAVKTCPGAQR